MAAVSATPAPSDPILAIGAASTKKDEAATGEEFAAALNGAVTAGEDAATTEAPDGTVVVPGLPILSPKLEPDDDDAAKSDILAALFATLPLPLDPMAPVTGTGEPGQSVEGVDVPASQDATLESIAAFLEQAAAEADEADAPTGADTDELNAVLDVDAAAPEVEMATQAPAEEAALSAATGTDVPDLTITVAATATTDDPVATEAESGPGPKAALPPGEAPSTSAVADAPPDAPPDKAPEATTSVVRPVGNAPQLNTDATIVVKPAGLDTAATVATGTKEDSKTPDQVSQGANQVPSPATQAPNVAAAAPAQQAPVTREPVQMQGQSLPQVADAIVDRLNSDGGEARVILDPPGMGEIVIKLHAAGGHVHVEVIAQRADALQVLRDGSPSLQTLLQDRGLDMGMAQFTLSQQGQGGQQQTPDETPRNTGTGFAQVLGIDEPDAANRNFNRLRAAYNPDGAHLYRV